MIILATILAFFVIVAAQFPAIGSCANWLCPCCS